MGQIIRLSIPNYPDNTAGLDPAECVLLIAVRWWVESGRQREDPMPRLCQGLESAGAADAALSVDALMRIIARSARRPVAIRCPRCPGVSHDEAHLMHAAGLMQTGDQRLAERALRTALLSAQGAEFALGPLRGLGELFAEAGWFFRRRQPPAATMEPWHPSPSSETIH